jgi:hypothetical protein
VSLLLLFSGGGGSSPAPALPPEALAAIADLDQALLEVGEDATLRRMQLVAGVQSVLSSVDVRIVMRQYGPQELVGGITQGDSFVILSPSEIIAANWPGTVTSPGDKRVPKHGDQLIVQGIARTVQTGTPFYIAGALVRLELQVRG